MEASGEASGRSRRRATPSTSPSAPITRQQHRGGAPSAPQLPRRRPIRRRGCRRPQRCLRCLVAAGGAIGTSVLRSGVAVGGWRVRAGYGLRGHSILPRFRVVSWALWTHGLKPLSVRKHGPYGLWTRQENIRTLARSSFDVSLVVVGRLPVYRRIAADATQMRAAGVSVRAISLHFGVDHHTAEKALRWFRAR